MYACIDICKRVCAWPTLGITQDQRRGRGGPDP